nr:MAG: hypothetical protein [Crogonang virus 18]
MQTSGGIMEDFASDVTPTLASASISDAEQHHSDAPQTAVANRRETTGKLTRRGETFPDRQMAKRRRTNGWGDNTYDVVDRAGKQGFCLFKAANHGSSWKVLAFRRLDDNECEDGLMERCGLIIRDVLVEEGEHSSNAAALATAVKHGLNHVPYNMTAPEDNGWLGAEIAWNHLCLWDAEELGGFCEIETGLDAHGFTYMRYWWSYEGDTERFASVHLLMGNLDQMAAQVEYVWGLDHKVRNRLVHALCGNTSTDTAAERERQRKFDEAYSKVHEIRTCTGGRLSCGRTFPVYLREHLRQRSGKYGDMRLQMCSGCRLYDKAAKEISEDWVDEVELEQAGAEAAGNGSDAGDEASDTVMSDVSGMGMTVGPVAPAMARVPVAVAVAQAVKKTHKPKQQQPSSTRPPKVDSHAGSEAKDDAREAQEKKPIADGPMVRPSCFEATWRKAIPAILADAVADTYSTHGAMGFGMQGQGGVPIVLLAGDVETLLQDNEAVYVVTKKVANFSGALFGIQYQMTPDFEFITVGDLVWRHHNWLYGTAKHRGGIGSTKLYSIDADGVAMDVWKLWKDETAPPVFCDNYAHHSADSTHYSWYIGSDVATVLRNGIRHDIRKATWQQASRFFSGTTAAAVAATQISGSLKQNEELSGGDIDAMLNVLAIRLEGKALHNARVRAGDRALWKEVADTVNDQLTRKPWWMPSIWWSFVSPYRRTWSAGADALYCILLITLVLSGLSIIAGCGGIINTLIMFDRVFIGAGGWADHILIQQMANGASSAARNFTEAYLSNKQPQHSAWHYIIRGGGQDYARWYYLKDEGAGDRVARAYDAAPSLHEMWMAWWISMFSIRGVLTLVQVFVWPWVEEFLKRSKVLVPLIYPVFVPDDMGAEWSRLAVAMSNGIDEEARVNAARRWANRHYWFSRIWRGAQGYAVTWLELGLVFNVMVIAVEVGLAGAWSHAFACIFIHTYCYLSTYGHAVGVHIVYNVCAALVGFPMASLVRAGKYMVSSVVAVGLAEFFKGKPGGRFARVEPMGGDSQFADYSKDPACDDKFPLKPGVKDDLKVKYRATKGKNRLTTLLSVFVLAASFASNTSNVLHSVYGRVLKDVPGCTADTGPLVKALDAMTKKMGHVEPDEPEAWAAKFPPRKRNRYLSALTFMSVVGYACFNDTLLGGRNAWDKRSCFLKHEVNLCQLDKVVFGSDGRAYVISCSDPRTIQASEDIVQCAAGPYFTAYGRRASEVFDGGDGSVVNGWRILMAFGRTKSETARIMRDMQNNSQNGIVDCGDDVFLIWNRRCYAIDASRWDAHVSATLLKLKARHLAGLGMAPEVINMLDRLIKRRGSYKGLGVRFELEGDVASGDPDTLYWNTVLGVAVVLSAVDGAGTFEEFADRCKAWGIEYELAAIGERLEPHAKLDFCSCVFVPCADGWTLAPKFGRSIMKLAYTANSGNPAALLASKVMGLSYDLSAYPDAVLILRQLLVDLPTAVEAQESYVPVGKVTPARFEEIDDIFRQRYGHTYQQVLDDLQTLVTRTRLGQMRSGDLTALQDCVAADYGKVPLPGPEPESAARRYPYARTGARRNMARAAMCVSLVGWLGQIIFGGETRLLRAYGTGKYQREGHERRGEWQRWAQAAQPAEEEGRKTGQRRAADQGQWGLHDWWSSSEGSFLPKEPPTEREFREGGEGNWRQNGSRPVEYHRGGGLRLQRHCPHTRPPDTGWEFETQDFKHGVRGGTHVGGRDGIQSENIQAEPVREGRFPMGKQDWHVVHEIQVHPTAVRVQVEHFRLCGEWAARYCDLCSDLQRGANVSVEAADGGGNACGVYETLKQYHVWGGVCTRRGCDELEMGTHGGTGGDEPHGPWCVCVRDFGAATARGDEAVIGRDLGPLHHGAAGSDFDHIEHGVRWGRRRHGHLELDSGSFRNGFGGHFAWGADRMVSACRLCKHCTDHVGGRQARDGLFRIDRHNGKPELVVQQTRAIRSQRFCVVDGVPESERSRTNVHCADHCRFGHSGPARSGDNSTVGASRCERVSICDHGECSGHEGEFQRLATIHEFGERGAERQHEWVELGLGRGPGNLSGG